jgi:hypothetical protein
MSTTPQPEYGFTAVDSHEQKVEIEFRPYDPAAGDYLEQVWQRMSQAVQSYHGLFPGVPAPGWANWRPWQWCERRRGYENCQKHIGWCGDHLVGFLNIWPNCPSAVQEGKAVLYVEHLAASPGDIDTELWVRRYEGIGYALVVYAVFQSRQQGFQGRVGLHAADEGALGFYRYLSEKHCQGKLWHPERTGVLGPTPYASPEREGAKAYLESSEEDALAWLERHRRG